MDQFVNAKILALILGITERRVNQLTTKEQLFKRDLNGKYDVVQSVHDFYEQKFSNDDELDYNREKALHEKAKREKTELQLAVMKGKLHHASDVERVMMDMLSSFKSKIRGLPVKIAGQIIPTSTTAQVAEIVGLEIDTTLQELSEYDPAKFYSDKYLEIEEDSGDEE